MRNSGDEVRSSGSGSSCGAAVALPNAPTKYIFLRYA
jgi:hypothetical protein